MSFHRPQSALEQRAEPALPNFERRNAELFRLSGALVEYDNDCSDRAFAIDAIANNRAAFWRTCTGQNQVGSLLTAEANGGADIIAFCKDRQIGRPSGFVVKHGLDVLVPLNAKATEKLLAAYEAFGEWRTVAELEARVTRKY